MAKSSIVPFTSELRQEIISLFIKDMVSFIMGQLKNMLSIKIDRQTDR